MRFVFPSCMRALGGLLLIAAMGCAPQLIGLATGNLNTGINTALTGMLYSYGTYMVPRSSAAPTNVPSFATGTPISYSISPSLPAGMSFNTSTGYITGTPSADTPGAGTPAYTTYTVTATNAVSSISYPVKLLVMQAFLVNSTAWDGTANTSDASAGNGVCLTPLSVCTLKAAIQEVNALAGAVPRAIFLSDGTYTLPAATPIAPSPAAATHIVMCGSSADNVIINGNNGTYVIDDSSGANMTLCNLTIRDGNEAAGSGAALFFATAAARTVNSNYVKFVSNSASQWGGAVVMDASNASAVMNFDHCLFDSNTAGQQGGAINHNDAGTLNISNSTFTGNTGTNGGGAIIIFNGGTANISTSTFYSNSTSVGGGGAIEVANTGVLRVVNSTFYSNTSVNGGGAISYATGSNCDVRFSTFYANSTTAAGAGGAIAKASGGGTLTTFANIFEGNLANGSANHCFNNTAAPLWVTAGRNVTASAGGSCGTSGSGDSSVASTGITTPAAYNGGEVLNFALSSSSAALNLISAATCVDVSAAAITTDTRGYSRPVGGSCDAGSFERQ